MPSPPPFSTPAARWSALTTRSPHATFHFVYCVRTTRIYCRPDCPSRLARRANVIFHDTAAAAEQAGFRPCKRCKPDDCQGVGASERRWEGQVEGVERAKRMMRRRKGGRVGLEEMAREAGMSKFHFCRVFKRVVGVTPREWEKKGVGEVEREKEVGMAVGDDGEEEGGMRNCNEALQAQTSGAAELDEIENISLLLDLSPSTPPTPAPHPSPTPPQIIYYTLHRTIFGPLLLAFRATTLILLELSESEYDLQVYLVEHLTPSSCRFVREKSSEKVKTSSSKGWADRDEEGHGQGLDDERRRRSEVVERVVEALERPCGRAMDWEVAVALEVPVA